ncbi:phasin family protein [Halomonas halocynthiae]|uniref:phasin family protein n=1 Tax=Halomonas halocynthiae TaxID=176290 RepID=UPI0009FE4D4C|nr:phasin family protein [Halomonas halocynthiae]
MKNFDTTQFENLFFGPARAFASLNLDFTEKLVNTQLEASKSYAEANMNQVRALLNVRDAEGLRTYMESQQKVAKDLTERMKGDAEKVVALQQDFVTKSQKLTEENTKQATAAAAKATRQA